MNDNQVKELTDRLDIIIRMMSAALIKEDSSPIEQIRTLSSVGMTPSQIGKQLGKPTNTITAYMVRIKNSKDKK